MELRKRKSITMYVGVLAVTFTGWLAFAQSSDPTIKKETISVHEVRRGTMPLSISASGFVTSADPPRATVTVEQQDAASIRAGQGCSVQVKPPKVLRGKITGVDHGNPAGRVTAEIELAEPLPAGAFIGAQAGALIDVSELRDVVFFARPAASHPNSAAILFVIEPNGEHARRVTVHYGRQSGPLIQVLSGLSPGDRVIVTDMTEWAADSRVRIE